MDPAYRRATTRYLGCLMAVCAICSNYAGAGTMLLVWGITAAILSTLGKSFREQRPPKPPCK